MGWSELPGELERFAAMLRREPGTRPTAEFIDSETGRFQAEWRAKRSVSAQRMPLPLPRDQALHPVGCQLFDCYLSFRFEEADGGAPRRAEFQVQVEAMLETSNALIELQDHWRIDSDLPSGIADPSKSSEGREPHPSFHFQRGGHAQDAFAGMAGFVPNMHTDLGAGSWRSLMQYPGPRIASLPFDPILAIDFCIAQHDGPLWKRLRNTPEYFSVIEEAQGRLWKPFFEALSSREARRRWLGPLAAV